MEHIPHLGFGTYRLKDETAYNSVLSALRLGYRHIDTAMRYGNESQVGRAIKDSGIERSAIWVTTKVPIDKKQCNESHIIKTIKNSLANLQVDYIDLILLHYPVHERADLNHLAKNLNAWKVLEKIVKGEIPELKDKVKKIGVSNYKITQLKEILENGSMKPYLNQIEISPYFLRDELVQYCKDQCILVEAHSSLVKGEKFNDEKLIHLSQETGISKSDLLLSWALSKGFIIIPRSCNCDHMVENKKVIDLRLDESVIKKLDQFHGPYYTHPQYV